MNRRDFLKKSIAASAGVAAAPLLINGLPLQAYGANSPYAHLATASNDRILIMVQLAGGNDGLNTVIPYDDPAYAAVRPKIGITYPQNIANNKPEGYVTIKAGSGSSGDPNQYSTGFNGRMASNTTGFTNNFYTMYRNSQLMVIQGVTYPNPNLSHFRATDIWMSGSDADSVLDTGWFGRYLDDENPNYQQTIQNAIKNNETPDPLAIQIGYSLSNVLIGPNGGMGIALSSPSAFYNLVNNNKGSDFSDAVPPAFGGNELQYVQTVIDESNIFSQRIKAAATTGTNKVAYPNDPHGFASQLKIVAQLISGGLKTKMYMVYIGGFDTHAGQNSGGGQPDLLQYVSEGIATFIQDLIAQQLDNRVMGMTFSEFGRRVHDNGSSGTDHGTAAPMFLFGTVVNGSILGTNPSLTNLDANGNLTMQYDYRQVYWSILDKWFNAPTNELSDALNGQSFTSLPIINGSVGVSEPAAVVSGLTLSQNYPNPFNHMTTIEYTVESYQDVTLKIFAENGREVATLVNEPKHYGKYQVPFSAQGLPSGNYIARLQSGSNIQTRVMQVVN
jgi:uncharacterized protein (DUF1501 family)